MKKVICLIACLSVAVIAQNEQVQPQQQTPPPEQGQYQYPPPQEQYQYPPQQYPPQQYQYPPQQGQYQYPPQQQQYYQYPPQQYQGVAEQQPTSKRKNKNAQQYPPLTEQQSKVQALIKTGLITNKEEIQKEVLYLSPNERQMLFDRNKKKLAALWAALDFGVGFGAGSYVQGDLPFAITQSIMDVVGWTSVIVGLANIEYSEYKCYDYNTRYDYCNYGYNEYYTDDSMLALMVSGWIVLGASRIMSWIFPFVYEKKYNRSLDEALNGSNNVSYSIDPLLVPRNNGVPAIGLAFNLRY